MNALPFHGGRLTLACTRFGGEPDSWLDLSTGINPSPWPHAETIRPDWHALPDPHALAQLEQVAATHFGADPAFCCAVPGSEAGLRAVGRILNLPGRHVPLSYGTYAQAFRTKEAAATSPSALIVGNPNNPDGHVTPRQSLLAALEQQERDGGWLIVDEAFADCRRSWSIADQVADDRKLIVTRSFGKFFGLAGVRLGFVLGPRSLLTHLRQLLGDWPVCAAAIAFGTPAYADTDWIAVTRLDLTATAERLDAILVRHGLRPKGFCPLFRLTDTDPAADLFSALARQRILTRPFPDHPGLLRFGLPADAGALNRLDEALAMAIRHG